MTADDVVRLLALAPHPEGGHFRETYRDNGHPRGASTAIYYLLKAGEHSHWHRVDAAEVWHWYAGDPLELSIAEAAASKAHTLGPNLTAGERPQIVVPKHAWQSARTLGRYTLVGCTVAPAFTFEGFEMAPPDWRPS
jgi:predicted cupin superfamily sugar epimerase